MGEAFLCDPMDVPLTFGNEDQDISHAEDSLIDGITRGLRQINKTPSEDSGVELGVTPGLLGRRDPNRQRLERKRNETMLITTNSTTEGDGWIEEGFGYPDDEYTALVKEHDDRHSSSKQRSKVLQKQYSERLHSSEDYRPEFEVHKQPNKLYKK